VTAAVTPPESDKARAEARSKARAAAGDADWLSLVLAHHEEIEGASGTEDQNARGNVRSSCFGRQLSSRRYV
jgi:hypothetical protein